MNQRPNIVVVGSVNADMVVKSERLPGPGETVTGGSFVLAAGGKGANQAVAAARLGARVTLIARVGRDLFGDQAIENYQREGIVVDRIVRDDARATGVALILVDQAGENLISVASGANHALSPDDVSQARDAIEKADAVVIQLETPLETVRAAARLAAEAGVPVVLDPAPAPAEPLDDALVKHVAYLKPNEHEATVLSGVPVRGPDSAKQAAEKLIAAGASNVIVTLGAQGAFWMGQEGHGFAPGHRVEAVDSTAAGDAFSGALACALARGETLADAVRFASVVGALSTTKMGAQPSLPTVAEVERFQASLSG